MLVPFPFNTFPLIVTFPNPVTATDPYVVDSLPVMLPLIVTFPLAFEQSRARVVALLKELKFDVMVNSGKLATKPPPADAVPPPTKVPALDAFVMRATFTFWSMVTVKLLEKMLWPSPFGGTAPPPHVAPLLQFPFATAR